MSWRSFWRWSGSSQPREELPCQLHELHAQLPIQIQVLARDEEVVARRAGSVIAPETGSMRLNAEVLVNRATREATIQVIPHRTWNTFLVHRIKISAQAFGEDQAWGNTDHRKEQGQGLNSGHNTKHDPERYEQDGDDRRVDAPHPVLNFAQLPPADHGIAKGPEQELSVLHEADANGRCHHGQRQ